MAETATKTVFVTGGSGYLGRNVLRALAAEGHALRALARSEASAARVSALGAVPVRGDLADVEALRRGMQGVTHVVHAAADTDHGDSSAGQLEANVGGTRNVLLAARDAKVRRAIHISTEAVLLDGEPLRNADESMPVSTSQRGSYSRTKAESERVALEASSEDFEVVVLRPRFVWGRDDSTALPQLVDAAKSGKLVWIGGGRYRTSTTHVANVAHAVGLALDRGRAGEVYFVTDGDPVPFREFVSALLVTQSTPVPTRSVPRWLVRAAVELGDFASRATGGAIHGPLSRQEFVTLGVEVTLNIEKAKRELGYEPVVSRDIGLAELASGVW